MQKPPTEGDALVDTLRKVCNTVLEVVMGHLHDVYRRVVSYHTRGPFLAPIRTRLVLNDGYCRTFGHLPRSVPQAIFRNDGIRIDQKDDFANTTCSSVRSPWPPSASRLLVWTSYAINVTVLAPELFVYTPRSVVSLTSIALHIARAQVCDCVHV